MPPFPTIIESSTLDGTNGFRINGATAGDHIGVAVSSAGDVNGDGCADLIIAAPYSSIAGPYSGAVYVVFGKYSGFGTTFELSSLNGSNGFRIAGQMASDHLGLSICSAGDVNGDGFGDLVIGAPGADPNGAESGAAYVVFGKASGFPAVLDLSNLD